MTLSLRTRLGLWYGGLTGIVVLLVGLFTYAIHARGQYDVLDETLQQAVNHVAGEYQAETTDPGRQAVVSAPLAAGVGVRVYDDVGQLRFESPYAQFAPTVSPLPLSSGQRPLPYDFIARLALPMHGRDVAQEALGLVVAQDRVRWRVYVQPLSGEFVVGLASLSQVDASVDDFRGLVPLLAVSGALIAMVAGWLLAGRALRPVADVTATAERIAGSATFEDRVPPPAHQDELGRLAATFNDMLDSLQESYRKQQRFVADVSHELRAPLTAIQANLELLERVRDMPEGERAIAVTEASREAQRLARMVADMLLLARADAGVPVRRQPLALNDVVLLSVEELRAVLNGRRLEVEALETARIDGDADRLKQLLVILLDNALKYTPATGRLGVSLRRQGQMAILSVKDTGVGIASNDLPHVFDRFYRADPARARDPGGSGLGLAIARAITSQHGGDISISSRPAEGTTVTVRLPLAQVAPRRTRPAAAA